MHNAILVSALLLATPLAGDQLRIATANDWHQWQLPGDDAEGDALTRSENHLISVAY